MSTENVGMKLISFTISLWTFWSINVVVV